MLLRPYLFSVSVDAGHVHGLFSCFLVPRWLALLAQFEDSEEDFDSRFDTDDELSYRRDSVYSCVTLPYFHSFLYMKGGSCGHPAPGSGTSPGPCPSPRARSSWRDGAGDRVLPGRTSPSPPSAGAVLGQGLRPLPPSSVPTLSVVSPLPNPPPTSTLTSLCLSHTCTIQPARAPLLALVQPLVTVSCVVPSPGALENLEGRSACGEKESAERATPVRAAPPVCPTPDEN